MRFVEFRLIWMIFLNWRHIVSWVKVDNISSRIHKNEYTLTKGKEKKTLRGLYERRHQSTKRYSQPIQEMYEKCLSLVYILLFQLIL